MRSSSLVCCIGLTLVTACSSSGGTGSSGAGSSGAGSSGGASCAVPATFACGGNKCKGKDEYCAIGDKDYEGAIGFPYICAGRPASSAPCKDCAWLLTQKGCFMNGTPTCTGSEETGFTITCKY